MNHSKLIERLRAHDQAPLADWLTRCAEPARDALAHDLARIDLDRLPEMRAAIAALRAKPARELQPAPVAEMADATFPFSPAPQAVAALAQGEALARAGRVACLLVAGGMGTRLGFDAPKGCYPLLPVSGLSLFSVFARRLRRAGVLYGRVPALYVMVSRQNEAATRAFFAEQGWFGLNAADVRFFSQGELPALDARGHLVLEAPDRLFLGPDGHGGVLDALRASGCLEDMIARGVTTLSYFQVDNVQVPVLDPLFLGMHVARQAEVSLKVVRKHDPAEKVGIFCLDHGRPGIVEYSEFSEAQAAQRTDDGLRFWAGSIAVHAFSVGFLARLAAGGAGLPLHAAHKKVPCVDPLTGQRVDPAQPNAYKFERFVFDTLPLARDVACLEVPREEQFLALKNPDGPQGPDGVRAAYQSYWKRALRLARPAWPEPALLEIDPLLCDNARELIALAARVPDRGPPDGDHWVLGEQAFSA